MCVCVCAMLQEGHVIQNLIDIQKQLRGIPIVQLHIPTIVLVGAPNVGKSSIVRALSTGTPEVNNYPFTTRGMTLVSRDFVYERVHAHLCVVVAQCGGACVPFAFKPAAAV